MQEGMIVRGTWIWTWVWLFDHPCADTVQPLRERHPLGKVWSMMLR